VADNSFGFIRETKVYDVEDDVADNSFGFIRETKVYDVEDDVADINCQALHAGLPAGPQEWQGLMDNARHEITRILNPR